MKRLVLDASIVLSWCFPDEGGSLGQRVLDSLSDAAAAVPAIWSLELANAVAVAERERRLNPADALRFLSLIRSLKVEIDAETAAHALGDTLVLARQHALSVYDASYLELAVRLGIPLATLDSALRRAARKLGVPLAGE